MIERFGSGGPFEDRIGYSRVVRAGSLFTTAGCTSVVGGELVHEGDPYEQTLTAFGVGLDALAAAGFADPRMLVEVELVGYVEGVS